MKPDDRKRRILIIDDDEEFLSDLTILLSEYFQIEVASGTQEAMDKMRQELPDCLLLDVEMPPYFGDDADISDFRVTGPVVGNFDVAQHLSHRPYEILLVELLTVDERAVDVEDESSTSHYCSHSLRNGKYTRWPWEDNPVAV